MTIKQLSLFLENKPGHLNAICHALADAGLNIVTLSVADTEQFGILRMIMQESEEARRVLESRGFMVHAGDVVGVEVEDRPGGMARILDILQEAGLNIEYSYAFTFRRGGSAVLIFGFDDPASAVDALRAAGCAVLGQEDLMALLRDS